MGVKLAQSGKQVSINVGRCKYYFIDVLTIHINGYTDAHNIHNPAIQATWLYLKAFFHGGYLYF